MTQPEKVLKQTADKLQRASKDLSKAIDNEAKAQSAFIDAYLNVLNQLNRR